MKKACFYRIKQAFDSFLVELEGLEPSSWNNPTFKRLQFSLTLNKTMPTA